MVEKGDAWFLGRRQKGLWGCWQFLFIDLGSVYMGIYLEVIIVLCVFVCVLYFPIKKLEKTPQSGSRQKGKPEHIRRHPRT